MPLHTPPPLVHVEKNAANLKSDCYFAFGGGDGDGGTSLAAPGESSNESAGETLDVEGFDGASGAGGMGAMAGGGQQGPPPTTAAPAAATSAFGGAAGLENAGQKPSRGIGIGIGVATAHRGMKRELSDPNVAGAAGRDGMDAGWGGMGGDTRRSMSEQQKLERRVRGRSVRRGVRREGRARGFAKLLLCLMRAGHCLPRCCRTAGLE